MGHRIKIYSDMIGLYCCLYGDLNISKKKKKSWWSAKYDPSHFQRRKTHQPLSHPQLGCVTILKILEMLPPSPQKKKKKKLILFP